MDTRGRLPALRLAGIYRDTFRFPGGRELAVPPRSNLVVYRALDLIARLLQGKPGLRGILYWAVGSGDPAWDAAPPSDPDPATRQLAREIYRKRLDPARDLRWEPESRTLVVRATFGPGEAVGPWRELGLFGGDASARPGSGYLINYGIHPVQEKAADAAVDRELRFSLTSETFPERGLELVLRLLGNQPGLGGIQYWALGTGDPAWDEALPPRDRLVQGLTREIFRRPVASAAQIDYDAPERTLVVRAEADLDEGVGVLRELGLFGGDASAEPGSGYLLGLDRHPALDKTRPLVLRREFRLQLGMDEREAVPDLSGLGLQPARAALAAGRLLLGSVEEVEAPDGAGQVVAQRPAAGERVSPGTPVDVILAIPERVEVPDLHGLRPAAATAALDAAGLTLAGEPLPTAESLAPAGTIVRQSPAPGERLARGAAVEAVLAVPPAVAVPDLAGLAEAEATALLRAFGLELAPPPRLTEESRAPRGTVIGQRPAAGERVPQGDPVEVTLAAPLAVPVPDLAEMTPDAAARALRDAAAPVLREAGLSSEPPGLSLGATTEEASPVREGTILRQRPAAGERAPLHTAVEIIVAVAATGRVPDLLGLTASAAGEALAAAGLRLGRAAHRQDLAVAGTVVAQEPRPGAVVPAGSAVGLILAAPLLTEVPDLTGRTRAFAEEALAGARLTLGTVASRVGQGRQGTILEQRPAAGERAPLGSAVELVILGGVPDVVGRTPEQARQVLAAAGLRLADPPFPQQVAPGPAGTILRQRPPAGATGAPEAVSIVLAARLPDVTGRTVVEAGPLVSSLGLELSLSQEESDQPAGTILRQEPLPGADSVPGNVVTVAVATPRTVEAPRVLGLDVAAAREELERVGLQLALGGEREGERAGVVLEQRPDAGRRVPRGRAVTVIVATAPSAEVPQLTGLPRDRAVEALASLRLSAAEETLESEREEGLVLRQSPDPGTRVPVDSTVRLLVASRPRVLVPSVIGLSLDRATALLQQVGLGLVRGRSEESDQPAGTVLRQAPEPGERVALGSSVRVSFATARRRDFPVVQAIWPANAQILSQAGPLEARQLQAWARRPRLELTFDRPMVEDRLARPDRWLRLWQILAAPGVLRMTVARRIALTFGGQVSDPVLRQEGVTYGFDFEDRSVLGQVPSRFVVQIRAEGGIVSEGEVPRPLDADFAGSRLSEDVLQRLWNLAEVERFTELTWAGLRDSGAALPSGDGAEGGTFHSWFGFTPQRT